MNIISNIFNPKSYKKVLKIIRRDGVLSFIGEIKSMLMPQRIKYKKWQYLHFPDKNELETQKNTKFVFSPKISIIVPVFNTPILFLKQMIDSVYDQSYSNWELCIANGTPENKEIINYLDSLEDERVLIKHLSSNKGISGNTNEALKLANGEYIALLDHDDVISPDALFEVVSALQEKRYDLLYSDEDFATEDLKQFKDPVFKPDWSPDLLCSHNYITHFLVVDKKIVNKVGGFRAEYDGAQDYDFVFRCTEISGNIFHIPKILYHWRICNNSVASNSENKLYAYEAGKKAIEAHLERVGEKGKVETLDVLGYYHVCYDTPNNPLVSIIIPNKDHINDLDTCIQSLYKINKYKNFEILVIENNSKDKNTFEYYKRQSKERKNFKVIDYKGEFNYSSINNLGVRHAKGEYILFLNNDTKLIEPNSLKDMLGLCMRDSIGAVGAKLLFDDNTIQHAGVVLGFGGFAGHVFTGENKDSYGYMMRPKINCNYSAVTGACLMTKKSVFNKVNGFSEIFKIGLNDVDFCLKVLSKNKLIVYDAESVWHHYESKSRGYDENSIQKKKRLEAEIDLFRRKWVAVLDKDDPYYNINFPINTDPYKYEIRKPILYCLDNVKFQKNRPCLTVSGWAVSTLNKKLDINIFEGNKIIKRKIKWVNRFDLYKNQLVSKSFDRPGFSINFDYDKNKTYKLEITDGKFRVSKSITYKELSKIRNEYNLNKKKLFYADDEYDKWFKHYRISDEELEKQKLVKFKNMPKFSIVVPLYKTPLNYLKILIDSVKNQSYDNWELCLSDGSGLANSKLRQYITKESKEDERIKTYISDIQLHISDNTNKAIYISTGDFVVFSDHDDELCSDALFECAKVINENPKTEMIYTDEDKMDMDGSFFYAPHFKPDYNPDMLRSGNYICHLCVVKRSLLDKVGLLRHKYDGAQDFDFILRCTEYTNNIFHIPKILYHWRAHIDSTANNPESKNYAYVSGSNALRDHYKRLGINAKVKQSSNKGLYRTTYLIENNPLVSIVVKNSNDKMTFNKCIDSLYKTNTYKNFELIIVNTPECNSKHKCSYNNIRYCDIKNEYSCYSSQNVGAKTSKGDYILFLDNNIKMLDKNSLMEMVQICSRSEVDIVGSKILTKDKKVEHVGKIIGLYETAANIYSGSISNNAGFCGRNIFTHNLSAVTDKCMLVKKSALERTNYFDESYIRFFADVDLCLKVIESNNLIVYSPYSKWLRMDNYKDFILEQNEFAHVFDNDAKLFRNNWMDFLLHEDPNYNINLSKSSVLFSLNWK